MHLEKPESDSPFAAENVSRVEVTYNSADVPTGSEPNRPVLSYYKLTAADTAPVKPEA